MPIEHINMAEFLFVNAIDSNVTDLGSPIKLELPASCFVLDADTRLLNFEHSALALEPYLNRLDFFDLCSKLALDQVRPQLFSNFLNFRINLTAN